VKLAKESDKEIDINSAISETDSNLQLKQAIKHVAEKVFVQQMRQGHVSAVSWVTSTKHMLRGMGGEYRCNLPIQTQSITSDLKLVNYFAK
jgi:hypothetical protein